MSLNLCPIIWANVISSPSQAVGSTTQRLVGTSLTWSCQAGYVLQDSTKATITCKTDSTWSGGIPTCIVNTATTTDQATSDLSEVIAAGTVAAIILLGLVVVFCCAAYWWANEEYVEIIHYTPTETTIPRQKLWVGNPVEDRTDIQSVNSRLGVAAMPAPDNRRYVQEVVLEPYERRGSYSDSINDDEIVEVIEERVITDESGRHHGHHQHQHHQHHLQQHHQPQARVIEGAVSGGDAQTRWWKPNTWRWNALPRLHRQQ